MPSRLALGDHCGEQGNTFSELKLLGRVVDHHPLSAFIGMLRSDLDLDIYQL